LKDSLTYLSTLKSHANIGFQLDAFVSRRDVIWFSCGAASAVMTKIVLAERPDATIVYCDTGSEHEDNVRFLNDCQNWYGKEIKIIKSQLFKNVDEVIEARNYMAGIDGAPCTVDLKKVPRMNFQIPDDVQYFGYTIEEWQRARNFVVNNIDLQLRFPLIYNLLTKEDCHAIIKEAGIKTPKMYELGFEHNNCLGCVKSQSAKYWAMIRLYFPDIFKRRIEQSRKLNVRLVKYKGQRIFLDELPEGIDFPDEKEAACDFLCQSIVEQISEPG